ncbi:hypothetical protein IVA87_28805 [Bradyrhizobium sp. 147]|uniref:DUF2232 domain-containing protein n=1 Tax=unclassified Bradyrhizobium TaxID=2631580 RepID=UPI001FFBF2B9|nr:MULTISPECIES: DUF2232 domain-containing protein [unclassified Bradyrhizobium]MCK1545854.1 hypothetical protein [Bradyrhizobium sp. 179]MCK1625047.1 hypothetical protein [Bradyrhizobium sp. 160]MCK1683290.1 hypothetical protein [Bradyrhizobium sp. 147]
MMAFGLIALIAGAASALMFASIISGALISLVLFYLAPLPLMVAAIGWGPLCASLGGIAAAIGLGALFGVPYCIAFAVTVALPAWWLGHLVLLGRPVGSVAPDASAFEPQAEPEVEWYPVGRILLWIAGFAALTTIAALLTLGTDADTISLTLRRGLMRLLRAADPQTSGEASQFVDALVRIAPAAATIVAMMTLTLSLWLSAKVTATSGRLRRPWPDLKTAELPPMTLVALCIALAFCFTGGLLAIVAQITTAALMMGYALTGFAVLHTLTLALKSRTFWLGSTYAVVVVFGWPVIAMVILGLADAVFGFRERFLRSRQPPPLPTS